MRLLLLLGGALLWWLLSGAGDRADGTPSPDRNPLGGLLQPSDRSATADGHGGLMEATTDALTRTVDHVGTALTPRADRTAEPGGPAESDAATEPSSEQRTGPAGTRPLRSPIDSLTGTVGTTVGSVTTTVRTTTQALTGTVRTTVDSVTGPVRTTAQALTGTVRSTVGSVTTTVRAILPPPASEPAGSPPSSLPSVAGGGGPAPGADALPAPAAPLHSAAGPPSATRAPVAVGSTSASSGATAAVVTSPFAHVSLPSTRSGAASGSPTDIPPSGPPLRPRPGNVDLATGGSTSTSVQDHPAAGPALPADPAAGSALSRGAALIAADAARPRIRTVLVQDRPG